MKTWHTILILCTLNYTALAKDNSMPEVEVDTRPDSFIQIKVGSGAEDDRSLNLSNEPGTLRSKVRRYPDYNTDAHAYYDRELRERIRLLEIAVRQLQNEVYRLRTQRSVTTIEKRRRLFYACMLTTPFGGTFHGKGETMLEAKAKSLNACEKDEKGFCREEKVVCERAE